MTPNTALGLFLIGAAGALRAPEKAGRAAKAASVLAAFVVLAVAWRRWSSTCWRSTSASTARS